MNKTIIAVVVVAVVLAGGYFLLQGTYQPAAPTNQPSNRQTTSQAPVSVESDSSTATPQPSVGKTPAARENAVIYTDSGYSPAVLKVKKGDTVTFKNQSSQSMWTASDVHPTHRAYPTTGGCIGSTFDSCKGVQSGNSWSFKFDIAGTWKYHNHLSPGDTGTIVVE